MTETRSERHTHSVLCVANPSGALTSVRHRPGDAIRHMYCTSYSISAAYAVRCPLGLQGAVLVAAAPTPQGMEDAV